MSTHPCPPFQERMGTNGNPRRITVTHGYLWHPRSSMRASFNVFLSVQLYGRTWEPLFESGLFGSCFCFHKDFVGPGPPRGWPRDPQKRFTITKRFSPPFRLGLLDYISNPAPSSFFSSFSSRGAGQIFGKKLFFVWGGILIFWVRHQSWGF